MPRPDDVDNADLNDWEKRGLERAEEFKRIGSAYALLHATKPATIGLVLASNPLSLLAWSVSSSRALTTDLIIRQDRREVSRLDRHLPTPHRDPRPRNPLLPHRHLPNIHLPVPPALHAGCRRRAREPRLVPAQATGVLVVPQGAGADSEGVGPDDWGSGVVQGTSCWWAFCCDGEAGGLARGYRGVCCAGVEVRTLTRT